ncbi:hypothetical protein [Fimbriiglobus ruber]|nr:hypothetical protein [Fimbriiglobus ruber]
MLYVSLFGSCVLQVVICRALLQREKPGWYIFWSSLAAIILPQCLLSFFPVVAIQAVFAIIALVFLDVPRHGKRLYLAGTFVVMIAAWAVVLFYAVEKQNWYADARGRFPLESLADRLPPSASRYAPSKPDDEKRLENLESDALLHSFQREYALRQLHENQVNLFVNSPGFGVMRVSLGPSLESLEKWHRTDTPVTMPGVLASPARGQSPEVIPASPARGQSPEVIPADLDELHFWGVVDFVHSGGFGYIRDRGHVAGFEPHGMSRIPDPSRLGWTVGTVELIGLLRETPVVYVSPNLPRMSELRAAPTRPLDPFETNGVAALIAGKDIVTEPTESGARMVGSIRAAKQCLACHEGSRGDLLGAFSYSLNPAR